MNYMANYETKITKFPEKKTQENTIMTLRDEKNFKTGDRNH